MDENRIEGVVREGVGRVQSAYGAGAGDFESDARGRLNQTRGSLQNLYGRSRDQARDAVDDILSAIREQPYAAAGVAALIGLVVGAVLSSGGARVIRSRR